MKKLPVQLAKDVVLEYELEQAIILCRDKDGIDHFVTYGQNKDKCEEAAIGADRLKRAFGWPEGSLSKYVTECALITCTAQMPHAHDSETGEVCQLPGVVTVAAALAALDNYDDFARMEVSVDPIGPRKVLEQFIKQHAQ